MPAPFTKQLCGYRPGGQPNTSDAHNKWSVVLGEAYFEALGVKRSAPEPARVGDVMRDHVVADLVRRSAEDAPHLAVEAEGVLYLYEQYAYLGAAKKLMDDVSGIRKSRALEQLRSLASSLSSPERERLGSLLQQLDEEHANSALERRVLLETLGEEAVLGLDVAISRPSPFPESTDPLLVAGFSLKWTLRTDRLQDPRSQGAKMSALRRGRMPHFAVVTMEPRPYFLGLLGHGSGDLDCVYHLDLHALADAIDSLCSGPGSKSSALKARDTLRRLRDQGRVRDYSDLVAYLPML